MEITPASPPQSRFLTTWFVLDAVLVLAPPLHWAVSDHATSVLDVPASLFYFLSVSVLITLSVLAAYRHDAQQH